MVPARELTTLIGQPPSMKPPMLPTDLRLRSEYLYATSLGSILLCIALWIRAKTIGEDQRGNAERRALFVGLWPPMFWLMGDAADRREQRMALPRGRLRSLLPK